MKKILFILYVVVFFSLCLYSFTQIDLGLVISRFHFFYQIEKAFQYIGYFNRPLSTSLYIFILIGLSVLYIVSLKLAIKKKIEKRLIWKIIVFGAILLAFSYNAFSYDIFNYIFDAKIITHYHANPYTHKALDYPGDPMLAFMHWTHRVYPYGPVWLLVTVPLSFIGLQFFLPTFFLFKIMISASYVGSTYFIGKIFQKIKPDKELFGIIFFGLNPLVLIESLISSHLDIVMMFFALLSLYYLLEKKYSISYSTLILSVGIKFLTGLFFPIYIVINYLQVKNKKNYWDRLFSIILLLLVCGIVIESKQSGNFQPWYLLSLLSFGVFLSNKYFVSLPLIIFSIASLLLYVPYLYLGNWNPPVPQILSWIMLISIVCSFLVGIITLVLNRSKRV